MDPSKEHIKQWVDALRSGEYEQGAGRLRKGDEFCCLGVACDMYQRETGKGIWREGTYSDEQSFRLDESVGAEGDSLYLPMFVAEWLGLHQSSRYYNPEVLRNGEFRRLSNLNDYSLDFEEIADILEANFLAEETANV